MPDSDEKMSLRRFILLDRDGTIIRDRNYISDPLDVELLPRSAEGLKKFVQMGFGLAVISNQSAVGRGYFSADKVDSVNNKLKSLLAGEGVKLDGIFTCMHKPEDGCSCRKPEPGLAIQAAGKLGIDLSKAFIIGDKACDIEIGRKTVSVSILVKTGYGESELERGGVFPDLVADDLLDAANKVESIVSDGLETEFTALHLAKSISTKQRVLRECVGSITRAAEMITQSMKHGGKLLICGNGGSAADSQHIAGEFVSVLSRKFMRPGLPAIALTTDTSFITASANDFGFDGIFMRQAQALGREGDTLLGISTSGDSENIVRAFSYARENGIRTIALTGGFKGRMDELADVSIKVPSDNTQNIQESHISIGHIICGLVERGIYTKPPAG